MKPTRASQPRVEPPAAQLSICDSASLQEDVQQVQLAIARRAYELFEIRGGEHGHDWEDWFRAESELLRPVAVSMSESEDRIGIRAHVLGFDDRELRVSVEPYRITILGKKKISEPEIEGGKNVYIDWHPGQIWRVIDLSTEVIPERAGVELHVGLLKFELPKAAKPKVESEVKAA